MAVGQIDVQNLGEFVHLVSIEAPGQVSQQVHLVFATVAII